MPDDEPTMTIFSGGHEYEPDDRLQVTIHGNSHVSFDAWSRWGGDGAGIVEGVGEVATAQHAIAGLTTAEALQLGRWLVENLTRAVGDDRTPNRQ